MWPQAWYACPLPAVQLGKNLVGHCLNKFRTEDTRADPESGSNPGCVINVSRLMFPGRSTASAHNPNGNRHSETPDENAPLIRPSADTGHPPESRDTDHHGHAASATHSQREN